MEGWTAIAIGIRKAGSLPELPGAVNGATIFAAWAKARGYKVHLVTDKKGPVRAEKLKTLLQTIVDKGQTSRLLVYFSGHGAQPSSAPFWLLSEWETDSDEAVNEAISRMNADRSGIEQIAFFVDACRVPVPGGQFINGFCLFPKRPPRPHAPSWDLFYGARVDAISQEVPGEDPVAAYGIFSACLMDGLAGRAEAAIDLRPGQKPGRAVTSHSLALYLQRETPLRSGVLARVQHPDPRPGWLPPDNIYLDADDLPRRAALKNGGGGPGRAELILAQVDVAIDAFEKRVADSPGRRSFKTQTGLSLIGARPLQAVTYPGGPPVDIFEENGAWHVRGYHRTGQSVLIEVEGGRWIAAEIFPDFVGAVLFEHEAVASIVYTPALNGPRDNQVPSHLIERAIYWTALMRLGHSVPASDVAEAIAGLTAYPQVNPTLAVLLAYACFDIGRLRDVARIEDALKAAAQPVPYDVSLLAQTPRETVDAVEGRFPLMSRGWALLEAAVDTPGVSVLNEVRSGLVPSLWTTLSPERGTQLSVLLEIGAV